MAINTAQQETVSTAKLLPAAAIGAGISAVINLIIFLILPNLLGVAPIMVQMGPPSPDTPLMELPAIAVIIISALPSFVAAGVLALLGRFTARPFTVFRVIAAVVLVLSFAPFTMGTMNSGTVITLGLMHIVAAGAIVWALDRRARA